MPENVTFANRYGLNVLVYAYGTDLSATGEDAVAPLLTIDFANTCEADISGDRVWATGGQGHVNRVAFNDPIQGTFRISTQLMTAKLLDLMAGNDIALENTADEIVFQNAANGTPVYYMVVATTVWQGEDKKSYAETLTFHKVCPRRALNISYSGEGDPTSVDVEFDVLEDPNTHKVLTIKKVAN